MDAPEGPPATSRRPVWIEALVIGVVIAAGLAVLLGLGVIQRKKTEDLPPPPPVPGSPPAPAELHALKVLEKFFEAADVEEKLATVRDPERIRPMMEDYHTKRGHPFPTMGRVSPGKPVNFGQRQCVLFEVEPFSGPRFPVAVEWDGFRYAVDWESLTAYGTMDWSQFCADKPRDAQLMRVYLATLPDSMRPPGAPAAWQPFRVEHRDSDMALMAVAGPELAPGLEKLISGKRVPLTVEIRWNGATCEIARLVASNWSQ